MDVNLVRGYVYYYIHIIQLSRSVHLAQDIQVEDRESSSTSTCAPSARPLRLPSRALAMQPLH